MMDALFLPRLRAFLRYYDLPGGGPPRLYLHCLGGAAALYLRTALHGALAARRAVLVDLLGFGFSDRPEEFGYGPADQAEVVAVLLDRLGLHGCDVIGHSMGGHVALALAVRRPDLVARLVLAEAPIAIGPGSASGAIAAQTEAHFRAVGFESFVGAIRAAAVAGDAGIAPFLGACQVAAPHAVYRNAVGLVRGMAMQRTSFLHLPLTRAYVWGARTLQETEHAGVLGELAAHGIESIVVPEAGHHMNLDNPAGFAGALAGLLDGE
jgi:pimeloyl-ACP methyl ester carboxylesterase